MENLEKETQIIAVEKVLEEMKKVEEFVTTWRAFWWEQCSNAYSEKLSHNEMYVSLSDLENKYQAHYSLLDVCNPGLRIGEPLRKAVLEDEEGNKYECEFGRIDWTNMNSNKSERSFSFKNNGDISFSKEDKKKQTIQHPRHISYTANYNVLSNNFTIDMELDGLIQDWRGKYEKKCDYITISFNENFLTEKVNDIEIIHDLNTDMKSVKIVKEYDKRNRKNNVSIGFEVILNSDDTLEKGAATINTHKRNGKINGTYRFDVSRKKGIRANFYSRKGVKIDLTENPSLLGTANHLLLAESSSKDSSDIIISDFTDSSQKAIVKNLDQKEIIFDSSDFNMEKVKQTEINVIEILKNIKGEIPLTGLVERVNYCLNLVDKKNNQKTLKLESKNSNKNG